MASDELNIPPHKILGVDPGVDLLDLNMARQRQIERWQARAEAGDMVAGQRIKRIERAYRVMADNIAERTRKDAIMEQQIAESLRGYSAMPHTPQPLSSAERLMMRNRIIRLVNDWNDYNRRIARRIERLDEIKGRHGDRFVRLRAVFQRHNDDVQTRWAAERYIRHLEHFGSAQGLKALGSRIGILAAQARDKDSLVRATMPHIELAEEELKERRACLDEAFEVMERKRRYISFYVP